MHLTTMTKIHARTFWSAYPVITDYQFGRDSLAYSKQIYTMSFMCSLLEEENYEKVLMIQLLFLHSLLFFYSLFSLLSAALILQQALAASLTVYSRTL